VALKRSKTLSAAEKADQIKRAVDSVPAAYRATVADTKQHADVVLGTMNAAQDYTINSRIQAMKPSVTYVTHQWFWGGKYPAFTMMNPLDEGPRVVVPAGQLPLRVTDLHHSAWDVFDLLTSTGSQQRSDGVLRGTPIEAGGQDQDQDQDQDQERETAQEAHKRIVSGALHHARNEEHDKSPDKGPDKSPGKSPDKGSGKSPGKARTLRGELEAGGKKAGAHQSDAFLRAIAEELNYTPEVPWGTIVADAVSSELQREGTPDFTYRRYNRHSAYAGYMLPALVARAPAEIAVCVDTSGSIDHTLLKMFQTHLEQFRQVHATAKFRIIYCDTRIRGDHTVSPGEPLEFKPVGGGGTNFDDVFKQVAADNYKPALMLWFTDMEVQLSHLPAPGFPVTWVYYHNGVFTGTLLPDWVPIEAVIPVNAMQG
jgi:hypothetical protein